jgi:hypothetical protein
MNRNTPRTTLWALATVAALGVAPAPAAADEAPLALSAPQLSDQFARCGYEVVGSRPAATYLTVRDAAPEDAQDSRIVMVFVYPDQETAAMAHVRAHDLAEQHVNTEVAFSDDHGPQLIAGFSSSVWRNNVALVESTRQTLAERSLAEPAGDTSSEAFNLGFSDPQAPPMVDSDFVNCLEHAASSVLAQPADAAQAALLLRELGSGQA